MSMPTLRSIMTVGDSFTRGVSGWPGVSACSLTDSPVGVQSCAEQVHAMRGAQGKEAQLISLISKAV